MKSIAYRRKTATERRRELIEAGIACLGRSGISGFTIDQICREAGVSRGLINHHFKTKEELLVQTYAIMTEHLLFEADAVDAESRLRDIVETSFDEQSFNRSNLRAWLSIWSEVPNNDALQALHVNRYRQYRQRIEAALKAAFEARDLQPDSASIARQMIALIDGLWLEYCLHAENFSLADARRDCYRFLRSCGIDCEGAR